MSSDSDDNLSPILTMRRLKKTHFNLSKTPLQMQPKKGYLSY